MPVETPSLFSRVIQEHLELKRRNAALDGDMPLARYMVDDPFSNHPLFKSEEQARMEETMDGASVGDVTMLLNRPGDDTAEHEVLAATPAPAPAAPPAAPAPRERAAAPDEASAERTSLDLSAPLSAADGADPDGATSLDVSAAIADPAAPIAPAPGMLPPAVPADDSSWGQSRDFDWGD